MSQRDEAIELLAGLYRRAESHPYIRSNEFMKAVDTILQALEHPPEGQEIYVIVERSGPKVAFVEMETEDGEGVSIPWHDYKDGMHRIGPLYHSQE